MHLREWSTNDVNLLDQIPSNDISTATEAKVLGMVWNRVKDEISVPVPKLTAIEGSQLTKRMLFQQLASVFDPLGYFTPVILPGKLLIQRLWQLKLNWDDRLHEDIQMEWFGIVSQWSSINGTSLQRHISGARDAKNVTLHGFCDASSKAYACAIYMVHDEGGIKKSTLLFSKTRVAPKKPITIPRMELMAVLIGVRALKFVRAEMNLNTSKCYVWSDSQCVLQWLTTDKPLAVFVNNRIQQIHSLCEDMIFSYVGTKQNPADLATRGTTLGELTSNLLWWQGPVWLTDDTMVYPKWNAKLPNPEVDDGEEFWSEVTKKAPVAAFVAVTKQPSLKIERYSTLGKLLNITVYVHRFLMKMIVSKLSQETYDKIPWEKYVSGSMTHGSGSPKPQDWKYAQNYWQRQIQQDYYPDVLKSVVVNTKNQMKDQMRLFMDSNGIMRCSLRMDNADMTYDSRFPILLPADSPYTKLVIEQMHKELKHGGTQITLASVRKIYWIPRGRATVRSVLQRCVPCKRIVGGPYSYPNMPPLPKERVRRMRAFQHTGVDYCGPIMIKHDGQRMKSWVCLFTCISTRAIHLEPVFDATASQFVDCFRRFVSRRGCPEKIISDHGKHFVLTKSLFDQFWSTVPQNENMQSYFTSKSIDWHMIPEHSPWMGGMYERLIGIVKSSFKKSVGRKLLTMDNLFTVLAEVEAVINTRPLSYVSDDPECRILTPQDFLLPDAPLGGLPLFEEDAKDQEYFPKLDNAVKLLQAWKRRQQHIDKFWILWEDEYLNSLKERACQQHKSTKVSVKSDVMLGEMVHVKEELQPRGSWRMGKIESVNHSKDGRVRSANVQLPDSSIITRPVNRLYPLEIKDENQESQENSASFHAYYGTSVRSSWTVKSIICITTLVLLFMSIGITGAASLGNKCSNNKRLTAVEGQSCVKAGMVVMRLPNNNLCYVTVICPHGHLQSDGKCGNVCECPSWSQGCSHLSGDYKKFMTNTNSTSEALKSLQVNFCSMEKDSKCNDQPTHMQLNQVMFFDNTVHLVSRLEMTFTQHVPDGTGVSTEYTCIGYGRTVGSPAYCQSHTCEADGTRFCYYKSVELAWLETEYDHILLKAWGTVTRKVYGPKNVPPETPLCESCSLKCIKGGLSLTLVPNLGEIEVCSRPKCYMISSPNANEIVMFPSTISVRRHEFEVKISSNGFLIKNFGITCPADAFCEMITCYVCKARLGNPECYPTAALISLMVLLYFSSVILYYGMKILKTLCMLLYFVGSITKKLVLNLVKCIRRRRNYREETDVEAARRRRPRRIRRPYRTRMNRTHLFLGSLAINIWASYTQACSVVTIMTAQKSVCTQEKTGSLECVINEVTRIVLVPQGQSSCLLLKDPNGEPLGTLSIEVEKLGLRCSKKNEYYTRSFIMDVSSVKRCAGAGSCAGTTNWNKCQDINTKSKPEELSDISKKYPGFTYCSESAGCGAAGCFYCTYACLFYRTFAQPVSDAIYEVFSCPSLPYQLKVTARLLTQGDQTQKTFQFSPGTTHHWDNMKLTLVSVSAPPIPLLGTKFLSDGVRTVMVTASASGQPISGTIGELQCGTKAKAHAFDCYIPHDSCQCTPQGTKVSCSCAERELESLFNNPEITLPLQTDTMHIYGSENTVEAEYNHHTALELQVSIEGMRMASKVSKNKCYITVHGFGGCYSCLTGARLDFTCRTDHGEALSHVSCGKGSFTTVCTPQGVTATTTMAFTQASINEECVASCPAGTSTFPLNATLVFIEKERSGKISNMVVGAEVSPSLDIGFLGSWLAGNWLAGIGVVIVVIILMLITIPLTPLLINSNQP